MAPVGVRTREVREKRVVEPYALKADARLEGVVTPDLADVVDDFIVVLYARLRTVRTEPKAEIPTYVHDRQGGPGVSLGNNAAEAIRRRIDRIHRLHRLEIKAGIANAQLIQSGGRKSVRPGD